MMDQSDMPSDAPDSAKNWTANAALIAAVNFVRTELKELVGRARLSEVLDAPCSQDCKSNFSMGTLPCDCWKSVRVSELCAELEAAIGKQAGKPEEQEK